MKMTTKINTRFDVDNIDAKLMTGKESWDILGDTVDGMDAEWITQHLKGMHPNWNCLEKAKVVFDNLEFHSSRKKIHVGSVFVESVDKQSSYGYGYNPPFEFHSWVVVDDTFIVDFALPGVIEMGLKTEDVIGPVVVGREPIVLAGIAPDWISYKTEAILEAGDIQIEFGDGLYYSKVIQGGK